MQTDTDLQNIYQEWKKKQEPLARSFYADPFTGKVPDFNKISYLHTFHLGGTVDAVLLGVSRYATRQDAYNNMKDFKEHESKFVFDRGKALEPFVAQQFSKLTRIPHQEGITVDGTEFGCDWSFAQVDFLAKDKDGLVPLEIKTAAMNGKYEDGDRVWGKGCEFNSSGELLVEDDTIPIEYFIQCQKQLWLTKSQYMYLCVWLTFETRVRVFKIYRNEKVISQIIEGEKDFLFNHVIPGIPYPEEDVALKDEVNEDVVYADQEFLYILQEYQRMSSEINELTKHKNELSKQIKAMMGEHSEVCDVNGKKLCQLTKFKVRDFDEQALKDNEPDVYRRYVIEKESSRFSVAKSKET